MEKIYTIIVAAGKGMRMNTAHSKVVQKIYDKEMIVRVAEIARKISGDNVIAVVGYKKEEIKETLKDFNIKYVYQEELLRNRWCSKKSKRNLKRWSTEKWLYYMEMFQ